MKKKTNWLTASHSHWTPKQRKHLFDCLKRGGKLLYYNSDPHGRPANGGSGTVCEPGAVHKTERAEICSTGLHATYEPHRWAGYRCWVVALFGKLDARDDKRCSAHREIIGEILPDEAVIYASARASLRASLYGANLYRASLNGANLNGADLNGANLNGANLNRASLYGASLNGADLNGADLYRANLYRASLNGANLNGADLYGADLNGADLYGADLNGANLNGADLYGADLNGAYAGGSLSPITVARLLEYGWIVGDDGYIRKK